MTNLVKLKIEGEQMSRQKMTNSEAIEVCRQWLSYLDRQRKKTVRLQQLAAKARKGRDEAEEARRELRQIDRQPKVYDGARLELAVQYLIAVLSDD